MITRRIAKNLFSVATSDLLVRIVGLMTTILIARHLGTEGYGVLAFAFSLTALLSVAADMGISNIMVREISRDYAKAGRYLGCSLVTKAVTSSTVVLLAILGILFFARSGHQSLVIILVLSSILPNTLAETFNTMFQAFQRMEFSSIARLLNKVILFLMFWLAVRSDYPLVGFGGIILLTGFISLAYSSVSATIVLPKSPISVDQPLCKFLLRQGALVAAASFFSLLYFQTNIIALSLFKGSDAVGIYSVAGQLVFGLYFIPSALDGALFPVLSKLFSSSKDEFVRFYGRLFRFAAIVAIPIGIIVFLQAKDIIHILFGQKFLLSASCLRVIIWAFVLVFLNRFSYLFYSMNEPKVLARQTIISLLINLLLNAALIPRYGYLGAGFATVLSEFVSLGYLYVVFVRTGNYFDHAGYFRIVLKVLVASIPMAGCILFFPFRNAFVVTGVGIITFIATLYVVHGFRLRPEGGLRITF